MIEAGFDGTWESWRITARKLLAAHISPEEVVWSQSTGQPALADLLTAPPESDSAVSLPKALIDDAQVVACHRAPTPWRNLYRVLYRVTHGERHILQVDSDRDILEFRRMEKAVRRDIHKMHAFVRFRKTETPEGDRYIAWHRPDHLIVRINANFFVRRFGAMHWAILTPDESAYWDTKQLRFGPGVPRSDAPQDDDLEELWKTYYASIFNPARVKINAMIKEMPTRHWATLPEADLIPQLLADAAGRVAAMAAKPVDSAAPFVPDSTDLTVLQAAAGACQGCDLYRYATQTVFGAGPSNARVVFVGEQPGDQEDLAGQPFVGPAGKVLNEAFHEVGIDRDSIYVTNAVKHFKFEERGKRRIHATPRGKEISACRSWLEAEMRSIKPALIVCLGATAAQAVFGRAVRIHAERGVFHTNHLATEAFVTIHPSALLRIPDPDLARTERIRFIADLKLVASKLNRN